MLVVIQNDGKEAIRLDRLKVEYVGPGNQRVEATPSKDVRYLRGPQRPSVASGTGGAGGDQDEEKSAGRVGDRGARRLRRRCCRPGQSASGFFYFQTELQTGLDGLHQRMTEAGTGKELFYFEIPLQ